MNVSAACWLSNVFGSAAVYTSFGIERVEKDNPASDRRASWQGLLRDPPQASVSDHTYILAFRICTLPAAKQLNPGARGAALLLPA